MKQLIKILFISFLFIFTVNLSFALDFKCTEYIYDEMPIQRMDMHT